MSRSKKLIALVVVLAVTLFTAGMTLVIALVESSQNAISKVKVKYTVADVYVEMQANYYIGSTATTMKDDDGNTSITLSPLNMTGALNQVDLDNGAILSRDNRKIIFEYIFINKSDKIPAVISQTKENDVPMLPVDKYNNVNITYTTSSVQLQQGAIGDKTTFADTGLGLSETKYVYVIVEIKNGLYDVDFEGSFGWSLTQGTTVNSSTASSNGNKIINVDANAQGLINGSDLAKINLVMGVENTEPTIYPMITDKCFVGWYTDSNYKTKAEFPLLVTESTTLYPKHLDATSDMYFNYNTFGDGGYAVCNNEDGYYESPEEVVIPDVYDDGVNGPAPVTGIEGYVFYENSTMKSLYIPNSVAYMNEMNLYNCYELTYLRISSRLTHIYEDIGSWEENSSDFVMSCTKLQTLDIEANHPFLSYKDGCLIDKVQKKLLKILSDDAIIPETVNVIGRYSIASENVTKTVIFPKNIKEIEMPFVEFSPSYNFSGVSIESGNGMYYSEDDAIIRRSDKCLIWSWKKTIIPSGITSIGPSAFSGCDALTSLLIPNSVVSIGSSAFSGCSKLTNVTIGSGVKKIGSNAFNNCSKLTSVTFSNPTGWTVTRSSTATTGDAVTISTTDLAANATLLKKTHVFKYWNRA